jgi:hypothetical protein
LPTGLAAAQPVELQANSLQSAIDNFVAYLKSETKRPRHGWADRLGNKDTIDAAKSHLGSLTADWGAALSRQKRD